MSTLPQKKSSMGLQKVDKTHISLVLSLRTYEQGAKQEALKGHFNLSSLKRKIARKIGSTMGYSLDIKKRKICVFHDPGIPKFERRVATSQQGVTKNTELYVTIYFLKFDRRN